MTNNDKPASKSRPRETTEGAMDEYQAKQKAELAKTGGLRRKQRPGVKPKAKRKLVAKGKRP